MRACGLTPQRRERQELRRREAAKATQRDGDAASERCSEMCVSGEAKFGHILSIILSIVTVRAVNIQ